MEKYQMNLKVELYPGPWIKLIYILLPGDQMMMEKLLKAQVVHIIQITEVIGLFIEE